MTRRGIFCSRAFRCLCERSKTLSSFTLNPALRFAFQREPTRHFAMRLFFHHDRAVISAGGEGLGGFSAPSPDRRRSLRHKVHAPAFVSFDGVTGGMILDLSEQGMAMQTAVPVESQKPLHLQLKLAEPPAFMETDGYVAWADALGRAGVRFSDLPEEARQRLDDWLEHNASTPSRKAPTLSFGELPGSGPERKDLENKSLGFRTVNLEWDTFMAENKTTNTASSTIQYQFNSLGST